LGEYQNAKRFYSEEPLRRKCSPGEEVDLPGSRDLASLEASALLWLGADAVAEGRREDALRDFLRAEQLVPKNPIVAYCTARALLDLHRGYKAIPRYRLAASAGHGRIREEAKRMVKELEAWYWQHPPAASGNAP
jgi:tetratricopeptide (TPR) repeat protein